MPAEDRPQIRIAEPEDLGELVRMRHALWPEGPPAEHAAELDGYFADRATDARIWVASRAPTGLSGFLELSIRSHAEGCEPGAVPYVEGWWVDPDTRGRGVGAALMEAAERWSAANGYDELASDTTIDDAASLAAHLALGFEEVERAVHFRKRVENSN